MKVCDACKMAEKGKATFKRVPVALGADGARQVDLCSRCLGKLNVAISRKLREIDKPPSLDG